jgi:hypothetical protein
LLPGGDWQYTEVYSFGSGESPRAPLLMDDQGHLFGTTYGGGHGFGLVFEITP